MKTRTFRGAAVGTGLVLALLLQSACSDRQEPADAEAGLDAQPASSEKPADTIGGSRTASGPPLNDTGVVFAGNHPRTVNQDCKGIISPDDEWVMDETFDRLEFVG